MATVRMAILGCGGMSGAHARRYRENDDVEIVALCDVKEEIAQGYIDKHLKDYPRHQPKIFTDAATMYAETKPDAVTIVTPHTAHFEHGLQAIEAGCHVFMEKPMVTDSGQAHQLAEAVKAAGKIFVVGYNTPCTPAFRYIRDVIRSGELGKLETVTGWQTQNWKKGTTGSWRQDPALSGGGQMYDSGAHMFNSLVWSVEQPIAEVLAFTDNLGTPVDINGTVNIRFANGVLATMTIAGNCPASAETTATTAASIAMVGAEAGLKSGKAPKKFSRNSKANPKLPTTTLLKRFKVRPNHKPARLTALSRAN